MSFKLPSIHWRIPYGDRNPEKMAGLIVTKDEDYESFFNIAKEYKFRMIFDGLAIKKKENCFSDP